MENMRNQKPNGSTKAEPTASKIDKEIEMLFEVKDKRIVIQQNHNRSIIKPHFGYSGYGCNGCRCCLKTSNNVLIGNVNVYILKNKNTTEQDKTSAKMEDDLEMFLRVLEDI